jgi:hypothetical protein
MKRPLAPLVAPAVPSPELWQGPLAWSGPDARAVDNFSRYFPEDAVFVRGEAIVTRVEEVSPGTTRQWEEALPALLHLERSKPAAVHLPGPDGRCWTFRRVSAGRRTAWVLLVGSTFPGTAPGTDAVRRFPFERIVVQSILPAQSGAGKHVSFAITDELSTEDFSRASDPDPRD